MQYQLLLPTNNDDLVFLHTRCRALSQMYSPIITPKMEAPFFVVKVTRKVGILAIEHS